MSHAPLTISLFGPIRVTVHGEPMPRVRTRSVEWLMALLALRNGKSTTRSWLAGTLWPDSEEERALHNLRDDLVRLRKALGPESTRIQSPTRDSLIFDVADAFVDALAFDECVRRGDEDSLRRAVDDLYAGPLLEGCGEAWAVQERESAELSFLAALDRLAGAEEQRGDWKAALALRTKAAASDKLSDHIQRGRMRALVALGDVPAAQMAYREHRQRLRLEMGIDPDEETTRLFRELRDGRATKLPMSTSANAAIVQATSPPVLAPVRSGIPHPLTRLVGRDEEVRTVLELLNQCRLVTLVGGGGVGKTRLAIAVASGAARGLEGQAAWVELGPLADSSLVLQSVLAALGISEDISAEDLDHAVSRVAARIQDNAQLLILDNCEHIIGPIAAVAVSLLQRCSNLKILATSRQRLGVPGERVWRVPSLPAPNIADLPLAPESAIQAALSFPAVRLFVDRASEARAGFRLAGYDDAVAVSRICLRLDGIPLALELAGSRSSVLSLMEIDRHLDDRFRLLAAVNRAGIPRHQTLRALIDWSYDSLNDDEKRLLRRLSVFAGGWTYGAAEVICDFHSPLPPLESADPSASAPNPGPGMSDYAGSDVLSVLASLVDKSLVQCDSSTDSTRYGLLETVNEYAAAKLRESGEADECELRHLAFYVQLIEESEKCLHRSGQELQISRVEQEIANVRAAMQRSLAHPERAELNLRLAGCLHFLWGWRGWFNEGLAHARAALDASGSSRSRARARALVTAYSLAVGHYSSGTDTSVEAHRYAHELDGLLPDIEDDGLTAEYFRHQCIAADNRGDFEAAVVLAEQSYRAFLRAGDEPGSALGLLQWGRAEFGLGNSARASELCKASLEHALRLQNEMCAAEALNSLGIFARKSGDISGARRYMEACLPIHRRMGRRAAVAYAVATLGSIERDDDSWHDAQAYLAEAVTIWRDLGNRAQLAWCLRTLADTEARIGQTSSVVPLLEEALGIYHEIDGQSDAATVSALLVTARGTANGRPTGIEAR